MSSEEITFVAVGGTDEIGMNFYMYGCGPRGRRRWIVVDCGIAFGDAETTPGVETMLPDPRFLQDGADEVAGIVLTHAHEDHIGAIGELWPRLGRPPIYATTFAAEVARRKLTEAGEATEGIMELATRAPTTIGDFEIEFYQVVHSIPDANLLAIRSPAGLIVHSGDFRVAAEAGSAEEAALRELGADGVICLVCESTNIFEPGESMSEADLLPRIQGLMAGCKGLVVATTFASNVERLRTLAQAAVACGRKVVVVGRAMRNMLSVAATTATVPDMPEWEMEMPRNEPASKLLCLATGSQGEPRAALSRMAFDPNPEVELGPRDLVLFSSSTVPGNERQVHRVQNALVRRGARVVDGEVARIHVSGHAGYEELGRLYELLRPHSAIPIHGEPRHLVEHERRAREWGAAVVHVPTDGEAVRIGADGLTPDGPLECGRYYREAKLILPEGRGVIRERRRMAECGHIAIAITLDERGSMLTEPVVYSRGAPHDDESWPDTLENMIAEEVAVAVRRMPDRRRTDSEELDKNVYKAAMRVARERWGRRPLITVLSNYVD